MENYNLPLLSWQSCVFRSDNYFIIYESPKTRKPCFSIYKIIGRSFTFIKEYKTKKAAYKYIEKRNETIRKRFLNMY